MVLTGISKSHIYKETWGREFAGMDGCDSLGKIIPLEFLQRDAMLDLVEWHYAKCTNNEKDEKLNSFQY